MVSIGDPWSGSSGAVSSLAAPLVFGALRAFTLLLLGRDGLALGTERCREHAGRLLDCLDVRGHDICKVRVKKVTVDITMGDDDCC